MKIKAVYVKEVLVHDPDTNGDVDLQVYKDPESGGMFAVDASYLDQLNSKIPSPFNKGTTLVCLEPGMREGFEDDKEWDDFDYHHTEEG